MGAQVEAPVLNPRPTRDIERDRLVGIAVPVEVKGIGRNSGAVSNVATGRIISEAKIIIRRADPAIGTIGVHEERVEPHVAGAAKPSRPALHAARIDRHLPSGYLGRLRPVLPARIRPQDGVRQHEGARIVPIHADMRIPGEGAIGNHEMTLRMRVDRPPTALIVDEETVRQMRSTHIAVDPPSFHG